MIVDVIMLTLYENVTDRQTDRWTDRDRRTDCAVETTDRMSSVSLLMGVDWSPILELQTREQLSHGQALRLLRG